MENTEAPNSPSSHRSENNAFKNKEEDNLVEVKQKTPWLTESRYKFLVGLGGTMIVFAELFIILYFIRPLLG